MNKKIHNPDLLYVHPAYSRAITISDPNRFHFIAGCTPADINYKCLHKGDMLKQYCAVMDGLDITLKDIGATWDDVVYRRIYVLNMDEFIKIQTTYDTKEWFTKGKYPPSTLVEVTRLSNPDFLIEIDLMAIT
ncbi:RidA family protein [Francisella hispaniensis]|nr:RidA family protein [Francisella hispaniensis]